MYILEDGIKLNATLDRPEKGGEKCPLVILIHGFTGYKEETHIRAAARAFNEMGLAVLRADMYGHGQSDGSFEDHTLYKWLTNILTLVSYARTLDFVTDLYLCGHSQGGLAVTLAAGMTRDLISGLIPLSPALMIPEGARKGTLLGQDFDPEHIPEELESWDGRKLKGNYIRVAQTIYPEQAMDRYQGPVLLIHGDEDEAVPLQCSLDAAQRFKNAELKIIPGDDHCYTRHLDQVTETLKDWIGRQLRDRGNRENQ